MSFHSCGHCLCNIMLFTFTASITFSCSVSSFYFSHLQRCSCRNRCFLRQCVGWGKFRYPLILSVIISWIRSCYFISLLWAAEFFQSLWRWYFQWCGCSSSFIFWDKCEAIVLNFVQIFYIIGTGFFCLETLLSLWVLQVSMND